MVRKISYEINSNFKNRIFVAYLQNYEGPKLLVAIANNGPARDIHSSAMDNKWFTEYYKLLIKPLIVHDNKHDTDLSDHSPRDIL